MDKAAVGLCICGTDTERSPPGTQCLSYGPSLHSDSNSETKVTTFSKIYTHSAYKYYLIRSDITLGKFRQMP